jgi:TolB-like protein
MRVAYALLGTLLLGITTLGAGLPITTIAGAPGPTTAPIAPTTVVLLPFRAVGQTADNAWISQAIDEDLAHDLSRNGAIRLLRPSTTQPAGDGLQAARDASAQRLISGSYQVVDDQLRINAELIDVNSAQPLAQAKATGRIRDLFQLEDSLAMQLWHNLPQGQGQVAADEFRVTPLQDDQVVSSSPEIYEPQPAPQVYDTAPDYGPSYDYTPYDSVYPYGGYGYGFGFPLFIYGGYGYQRGGYHGHYGGGGGFHSGTAIHGASPAFAGGGGHFSGGGAHFSGGGGQFGGGGHR